ncbi:hypothetical protein [Pseudomonas asiatica]|uniref:hypothetical protein n=1 Tax=Pseudomonas asiatica TaxID=2219225 RepID=UPI000C2355B4|nr:MULTISPECIES: hypothetical protein [Pseudomonas]CAB5644143.1 Uncharacterised protein [Pseudomonas putida]MBO2923781.1 hypothetical protein [Pseudomonas asiatica]PJI71004.1 hypothetical protein CSW00_26090 [Pseudomonas sp. MR 02]WPU58235.1 hypothetical protein SQW15_16050 [Pseudomonas asiatica]CAB5690693.1 Uncharacterised protein [Pseudomonas putida]
MIQGGTKLRHIKADNYITEMVDQFNVAGTGGDQPGSQRIILIAGRNEVEITEETLVEVTPGNLQAQTLPDAMVMTRKVYANLSMTLESAQGLVQALQQAIAQAELMKAK